jgi:hypothetical protein
MFIGKSGHGRILLDGNNSIIQSSSYAANSKGMLIDLDDGIIDMRGIVADKNKNTTPTNSRVHIDITSPYFFIDDENSKRLIHIASNNYYL